MSLFVECALACALLTPAQSGSVPMQTTAHAADFLAVHHGLLDFRANCSSCHVGIEADPAFTRVDTDASQRPPVDEEIEVMRALLLRKISNASDLILWKNASRILGDITTLERAVSAVQPSVEGTYLDGHGVVFTVSMPALARHDPRPSAATPETAPLTEWEKTRRQIRGEPVPEQAATKPQEPSLSDVLLRLLSDNGQHFTHLRDDERLTVVVTFRGDGHAAGQPVTESDKRPGLGGATQLGGGAGLAQPGGLGSVRSAQPGGLGSVRSAQPGGLGSVRSAQPGGLITGGLGLSTGQWLRDLELLADLHLKQGQNDEALAVLQKALEQVEHAFKQIQGSGYGPNHPDVVRLAQMMSSLYAKQAQALLASGKVEEARKALVKAGQPKPEPPPFLIPEPSPSSVIIPPSATPTKPAGPNLPAKLTVSATKRQLDQVGSGKMSFEEFRQEAKVEFYPATGAEKPAAGGEKK